jgi:hypothetical protein
MAAKSEYWFPAKTHGWGWGPPTAWQGWAVIAVYVALICVSIVLSKVYHLFTQGQHLVVAAFLTLGLILVCWLKGEPPRWRWGNN